MTNCNPDTTVPADPAPVDPPLDPSKAGVNKETHPESLPQPPEKLPMPAGVSISIPQIWSKSPVSSAFHSLTDPSSDESVIYISTAKYEEQGAHGLDKLNFMVHAELEKLGYVANIAVALAWDPGKWPTRPLIYQSNLKSAAAVDWKHRTEFMPDYPYMRQKGEHELVILAQLRQVSTKWKYKDEDYISFTEFPHLGETVSRSIRVVIQD